MPLSESPELDSLLERKLANFRDFQKEQEGVWDTVNGAYLVSRGLVSAVAKDGVLPAGGSHRLTMWQTVLNYQMESFFLLIDRRLDEGLALLRMAAELARDVGRISDDATLVDTWLNRVNGKAQKNAYRDAFRFSDSDRIEVYVHKLYDLASTFGIHGHTLTSSSLQPNRLSPDGKVFALGVPDVEVYRTIEIWLAAFFPLQELCHRVFRVTGGATVVQAGLHYDQMRKAFDDVFAMYRESLQKLDADVLAGLH
ncbi:MAG: hypothetical protein HY942_07590 [Gammaproteobacteria bacterium]|nr:hypothetical protein [Gammaproteobacteria bacterium]